MWGQIASAGIGALGGMLGGNDEHIGPGDLIPRWLHDDWEWAGTSVRDLPTPQYYQGQLIADMNPYLGGAIQGMGGFGQEGGFGYDAANAMMGYGMQGAGAIGQGLDFMSGLQERGPNQFQYDQGTYDQILANLSGEGRMQDAFDFGSNQLQQQFDWGTLPGLNMDAALGNAQGSTKTFQQGALGQAMTNQAIQQFGTDLWQNAANMANQGAMSAGTQNLAGANAFDTGMLQNYGTFGNLGARMMGQGYDMGRSNLGLGLQAGQLQQGYDQSLIDAEQQKWNFEQQAPWTALDNQIRMMGAFQMGATPHHTGASPWETALQGAQAGLGIYGAGQDAGWWGNGSSNVLPFSWSPFDQGSAWDGEF